MNNKTLFGVMCILFNCIGVPNFMQGKSKTGILKIVLYIVTCGIVGAINAIMGILLGIKVLKMTDEEFEAEKYNLDAGIPKAK